MIRALRGRLPEAALVLLAAALLLAPHTLTALRPEWARATTNPAFAPRPKPSREAYLRLAVLELADGAWQVRPGSVIDVPTRELDTFEERYASDRTELLPAPPTYVAVSAPLSRRRVNEWAIERDYAASVEPTPGLSTRTSRVLRMGGRIQAPPRLQVTLGQIRTAEPRSYAPDRDGDLPVATLALPRAELPENADQWRDAVARELDRLAAACEPPRTDAARYAFWSEQRAYVIDVARLAALLCVPESLPALERLRAGTTEPFAVTIDGREVDLGATSMLEAAIHVLTDDGSRTRVADIRSLLGAGPGTWLRDNAAQRPAVRNVGRAAPGRGYRPGAARRRTPTPRPREPGRIAVGLALIAALIAFLGPRGRLGAWDVIALPLGIAGTCVTTPLFDGVAAEVVGLAAVGALFAALHHRCALPRSQPTFVAFFAAAGLLLIADAVDLAAADAAGRAAAFVGLAMAAWSVTPPSPTQRGPRRAAGSSSTSLQLAFLAVGTAAALVEALVLVPRRAAFRTGVEPELADIVFALAIVAASAAGVVAYARRAPNASDRAPPLLAGAVAWGAAAQIATLAALPLVVHARIEREWAPRDVGAVGAALLCAWLLAAAVAAAVRGRRTARSAPA